jgi:thiol-disulfide isomerase/thioredoxin
MVGVLVVALAAGVSMVIIRSQDAKPALPPAARGCGQARSLLAVGTQLPGGCKFQALGTGAAVTLADYASGKPIVLNFWASWCAACIQEMPELQKVYASAAEAVQFLGVDLLGVEGETRSGAESFARQRSVTYPLAYDEGGLLYGRISLRVLAPTTAFVRADGTLAGVHIGQLDAAELRGLIVQYLGIQVAA